MCNLFIHHHVFCLLWSCWKCMIFVFSVRLKSIVLRFFILRFSAFSISCSKCVNQCNIWIWQSWGEMKCLSQGGYVIELSLVFWCSKWIQQTCVSAKIARFPGFEPTPVGIHVLITCGLSSSWAWSKHSMASVCAASSKPYRIVFKKLYAGFGGATLCW